MPSYSRKSSGNFGTPAMPDSYSSHVDVMLPGLFLAQGGKRTSSSDSPLCLVPMSK